MGTNPFSLEKAIEIQGYDIDYGGVVSNIVYVRWLDDLRSALMKEHYPIEQMAKDRVALVVNKTFAHYKKTASFGDSLCAFIEMKKLEGIRWELEAVIKNSSSGKVIFSAVQSGAFIDLDKGKPVSAPEILVSKWKSFISR